MRMTSLSQIKHWVRPCFHTNVSWWKLSTLGWTGITSPLDMGSKVKPPQPPFPWKRKKPAHGTIALNTFSLDGIVPLSVAMLLPHTNTLPTSGLARKQQRFSVSYVAMWQALVSKAFSRKWCCFREIVPILQPERQECSLARPPVHHRTHAIPSYTVDCGREEPEGSM